MGAGEGKPLAALTQDAAIKCSVGKNETNRRQAESGDIRGSLAQYRCP